MSYFALSPVDTIPEDEVLLAWAEVWAFATGSFAISDLALDKEVVLADLGAIFPDEDTRDLAAEPGFAWERVLEELQLRIIAAAERAREDLSFKYPFKVQSEEGIVLSFDASSNDLFSACYIAMQLESLFRNKLVSFWNLGGRSEDSKNFLREFRRVFEVISAVAVANFKHGIPVLVGESRSVEKALLPAISEVCELIGKGVPKTMEQLNQKQKDANDGGIDVFVIFKDEQQVFECVMVGATTQQSSLRTKVMDQMTRERVSNYFVDRTILGPQSGMLTHSNPYDDGDYNICTEGNCAYLPREKILKHFYDCNLRTPLHKRSYLRSVKAARAPLGVLSKLQFQREFDFLPLPCIS